VHNYAGNPASFPTTIPLIDDSDPPDASHFNPGPEGLADRTAWLNAHMLPLSGGTLTGNLVLSSGVELFLTGTAQEVVEVSASILNEGTIEVASGGTLLLDTGCTVTGTISAGTIHMLGSMSLDRLGAVVTNHNQAIQAANAGGIAATVAGGIASAVAGGIQSSTPGGIACEGGATDYVGLGPSRNKETASIPIVVDPSKIDGTNWSGGYYLTGKASGSSTLTLQIPGLHQGATLTSVTINFVVTGPHSGTPNVFPAITVFRQGIAAGSTLPLSQALDSTVIHHFPNPGSGAAYDAGGVVQPLTYPCTQNNVIDLANYTYAIQLTDENGSGSVAGNLYVAVIPTYQNITSMAFSDGAVS
jgi:hypothetical protein